jgi:prepilin-type N-terminal cleavage/methylation domain-containing protein
MRLMRNSRGFTLVEALIAIMLTAILLAATLAILRPAGDLSSLVKARGELQQNARVALNSLSRELSISGTGFPLGGIQLPAGDNSSPSLFACTFGHCYVADNTYQDERLYAVTPGSGRGSSIAGVPTDVVTLSYRDDSYSLDQYPLTYINATGTVIRVDSRTTPAISDPVVGIQAGDFLVLSNANGCAAAVVTSVGSSEIDLRAGDPLRINQVTAEYGNVKALQNPGGGFPPTRAYRVNVVTYFLDTTIEDNPRLMRQVSAHEAEPVAEHVENLQLTYDIFEDDTSASSSDLPNAGDRPNQIRKINLFVAARSPGERLFGKGFDRTTMRTAVSARNLVFRDRYE